MRFTKIAALLFLAFIIVTCQESVSSKRTENRKPANYSASDATALREERGTLISAEFVRRVRTETIDNTYQKRGFTALNDVYVYNITYISEDLTGEALILSGALYFPVGEQSDYPMISVQHGTITSNANAPSQNYREGLLEASQGFITVAADYHGFGTSKELVHPYLIEKAYQLSSLDALLAAGEFVVNRGYILDGLYLKGYSEGGYATLALQKIIETQFNTAAKLEQLGLELKASAPGAGPYQMGAVGLRLVAAEQVNSLYLTKVITAYKHWLPDIVTGGYSMMLSLTGFGKTNEAELKSLMEETLYSGEKNYFEILDSLPKAKTEVLSEDIIAAFGRAQLSRLGEVVSADEDETGLLTALEANNLVKDWSPETPTRLYHCVSDEVVPFAASISAKLAFDYWDDLDASTENPQVKLVRITDEEGETPYGHGLCPGVHEPIKWFQTLYGISAEVQD